ncbi:MAG TPA: carboxylating nicotinate-nucleotide diphosphorylase [Acidimicrobiia bacterium]|nr:carboxylating nicotinate-nucleotide diphosphorylase [Acidimicrobiia bacterium]
MEPSDYLVVIDQALAEDLGDRGDITSNSVISADSRSTGRIVARAPGIVAGVQVAGAVFERVDPTLSYRPARSDGDPVDYGDAIATVDGPSRSILTAERTALNLLGRMSGVATATARLAEEVAGTGSRITDTRKTMPGLRMLDKHAVAAGGGVNHRFGLYDQVMIKDNHIVAAGSLEDAVAAARVAVGADVKITVEVENLSQLSVALSTSADRVLLDNMDLGELRAAVEMVGGSVETEASGGVKLETVRAIAETGVDFISVGWITHSPPQLDVALDFA